MLPDLRVLAAPTCEMVRRVRLCVGAFGTPFIPPHHQPPGHQTIVYGINYITCFL